MTRFSAAVYSGSSITRIRSRSIAGTGPSPVAVATKNASDRSKGRSR